MNDLATPDVETTLRAELARGDRALGGVAPVLSHMLASDGHALVNEDVVARLRGMLADCAAQLLSGVTPNKGRSAPVPAMIDALANDLSTNGPLLSHLYALAMEGHLTHRLDQRSSIDPVLSPLFQQLIASDQAETAELAMQALSAQSRFVQMQRRMALPITELPALLFGAVLKRAASQMDAHATSSIAQLRMAYDEASTRLGLLTRLTAAIRSGAIAGLELDHAGLALFATSLSALTRQPRDLCILACHDRQAARLALGLRAAGLDVGDIERQFLLLEPAERLPKLIGDIPPHKAAEMLRQSPVWKGD